MKTKFFLSIAFALACSATFAQTSLRKLQAEEDTLSKYYSDILKSTNLIENECEVEIGLKYKVPLNKVLKLSHLVKERERRKVCYNYIYGDSTITRVRCKLEIDSIYRDSINTLLIPVKGNRISGDNISLALRYEKLLKLDEAQYNSLMDKALSMARKIYSSPRTNVWNEEMNVLRKTLTPKQLSLFFSSKNSKSVSKELDDAWKQLVDAGLSVQLDSAKEFPLAFRYLHERQKIKDIFRYYGTSQKKYLAELDKHKPAMIQMLATLEKQKNNKSNNKSVGKEFVW